MRGFVYFSSVKAAADPGERCVDETSNAWPQDAYGRSKREAEELVLTAGREHDLHVCNLRPCLVYWPGVKGNLARMIDAIERGRFPLLPEFTNRRSMVGLDDLLAAAQVAMGAPAARGCTYILSDDAPCSSRELYLSIRKALGQRVPVWAVPHWLLRLGATTGDVMGQAAVSADAPRQCGFAALGSFGLLSLRADPPATRLAAQADLRRRAPGDDRGATVGPSAH